MFANRQEIKKGTKAFCSQKKVRNEKENDRNEMLGAVVTKTSIPCLTVRH